MRVLIFEVFILIFGTFISECPPPRGNALIECDIACKIRFDFGFRKVKKGLRVRRKI